MRPAEQPCASQSAGATPSDMGPTYSRTSTAQGQSVHESTAGVDIPRDHRASADAPSAVQVAAGRQPSSAGSPSGAHASESHREVRAHRLNSRAHCIVPESTQSSISEESSIPSLHAMEGAREPFLGASQETQEQGMRSSEEGGLSVSDASSCEDNNAGAGSEGVAEAQEECPQDGNGSAVPPLLFNSYALQGYILLCCQVPLDVSNDSMHLASRNL